MFTLFFFIQDLLGSLRWNHSVKVCYAYKCFAYFFNYKGENKKSIFKVICEVEKMSIFWRCFPDMYFKMSMFTSEWRDLDIMKSFVPQAAFYRIEERLDKRYNMLIDDKVVFHDLMNYYHIPVPHVFFLLKDNHLFSPDQVEEYTEEQVNKLLSEIKENRIFVKRYSGGEATSVFVFEKHNGSFYDGANMVDAHYIKMKYKNEKFFFEQQIHQHEILNMLNPDTVNTTRVLASFDSHQDAKIYSATLRVGRKGSYVDNAAQGGISIPVDLSTGALGKYGVMMYSPVKYEKHPDSQCEFSIITMPHWDKVINVVKKVLRTLPPFMYVGFDIAITQDGPVITEINTGSGMFLSQAGRERGLGKRFICEKN